MHRLQAVHGDDQPVAGEHTDCAAWDGRGTLQGGSMTHDYMAWVRFADGTEQQWMGLRKEQARWRYHWIRRNWWDHFRDAKGWGWRLEP